MDKQEKLTARLFKDTLIVIVLSMLAEKTGLLIDGTLTGSFLGTAAIAAFGLTVPYQKFVIIFTLVMALGMQILCSQALGAGKLREANGIFSLATVAVVCVTILLFIGTVLFTGQIIDLLGATAEHAAIHEQAVDYLKAYSFALPAVALMAIFTPIMQLDNDRRRTVFAVVLMSVCNIAGDLINIFVLNGGLWGMGIATTISYWIAVGFLFLHFLKPNSNFKFTLEAIDLKFFGKMFKIGSPLILGSLALTLRRIFFNRLTLAVAGEPGLAAYAVLGNFAGILDTFPKSSASATQMISGILVGEKDRNSIRRLIFIALKISLVGSVVLMIVALVAAPLVADLYIENDPVTFEETVDAVRWFALGLPLYTFSLTFQYFYQAYGRFRLVTLLAIWNTLMFSVPAALLLSNQLGITGLWCSIMLNQVAYVLAVFVITCRFHRKITFRLEDYLLLPDDFDVSEDRRLDITVTNKAEVLGLSETAQDFCENKGIDVKRSMFAGICIEEMAGNIVDYGFSDGKKHFVDVRVIVDGQQVIIRIRDDCRSFDPKKQVELYNSEDPAAHIGIRLCRKIATEFNYVNVLKLNNLIIKI